MKIDRHIGIITALLQSEKVTAPCLAERFEVSKRTISRDIEDICKAGIPIVTTQGAGGGISIAPRFKLDCTLFTPGELRSIMEGLTCLDSVSADKQYRRIMGKLAPPEKRDACIAIDLSGYYKDTLAPKIALIRRAIDDGIQIAFDYYSGSGERRVALEPAMVVFRWSSWYVYGYDGQRQGFRLYKLNRLWELERTNQPFTPREMPSDPPDFDNFFTDQISAVILFESSEKHKLIESYGVNCYQEQKDGKLRFEFTFTNSDYLLGWILSFGDKAELLEPQDLRERLQTALKNALNIYT